jgi:hypothetical protein
VFASVPESSAPEITGRFGRVPLIATVDGKHWATSVWRDKAAGWPLPVPARIRGGKDDGDSVTVAITVDVARL